MTIQRPSKPEEITDAIATGRPFQGSKINADHIAVLSGSLGDRHGLTGPLAGEVVRTMLDYSEQYLTGGGRERAAWHAVYYVTMPDPSEPGKWHVLAYVTASGSTHMQAHPTLSKPLTAAVSEGIRHLKTSRTWDRLATDRGDYPTQPEGHRDGEGLAFTLWGRDTRTDVRQTLALAHYGDRGEAYQAMRDYEAAGEPYTSPTGYRGTHNHAWITRDTPPIGTVWAAWKGSRA